MQVTLFYDSVLMFQHYVLYRGKKAVVSHKDNEKMRESLISQSPTDVTDQLIKGSEKCCDQSPPVAEVWDIVFAIQYIYNTIPCP